MAAHVQSHDPLRILIVDPADPSEIDDLLLRSLGADVRVARSGWSALDSTLGWVPTVLVTELFLPDMTAFQLVATLRSNLPQQSSFRVVAVSARARLQDRLRVSEAGFDAFFRKPVSPDDLRKAVGLDRGPPETD